MEKKQYSQTVVTICLIAFLFIVGWTACKGQAIQETGPTPDPYGHFRWNASGYFKTNEYLQAPDTKPLDWASYSTTWDGKQFALWATFALTGICHGMREAYHADPTVFERKWGVSDRSFFGSEAWVRNYQENNPDLPHKTEIIGNFGRDVWHTANIIDFAPLVYATTATAFRNQPKKYRVANLLLGIGVRTVFSYVTYKALRS